MAKLIEGLHFADWEVLWKHCIEWYGAVHKAFTYHCHLVAAPLLRTDTHCKTLYKTACLRYNKYMYIWGIHFIYCLDRDLYPEVACCNRWLWSFLNTNTSSNKGVNIFLLLPLKTVFVLTREIAKYYFKSSRIFVIYCSVIFLYIAGQTNRLGALTGICNSLQPANSEKFVPSNLPKGNRLLHFITLCCHQEPDYRPHAAGSIWDLLSLQGL